MSNERSSAETEINDYIEDLNGWVASIQTQVTDVEHEGVAKRLVRDMETLKSDMTDCGTVTASDLNDFNDRHASLEIQYNNLISTEDADVE